MAIQAIGQSGSTDRGIESFCALLGTITVTNAFHLIHLPRFEPRAEDETSSCPGEHFNLEIHLRRHTTLRHREKP